MHQVETHQIAVHKDQRRRGMRTNSLEIGHGRIASQSTQLRLAGNRGQRQFELLGDRSQQLCRILDRSLSPLFIFSPVYQNIPSGIVPTRDILLNYNHVTGRRSGWAVYYRPGRP